MNKLVSMVLALVVFTYAPSHHAPKHPHVGFGCAHSKYCAAAQWHLWDHQRQL